MHVLPRALLLLALAAAGVRAQQPGEPPAGKRPHPGGRRAIPGNSPDCHTGSISYIFIDNHSIFDASDASLPTRFGWAYSTANRLHIRTRQGVIRRELLLRTGDCYDPALVDESARLLRGFDFVSRADVYGVPQPDSTYHLVVDTQDEWSTDVGLRLAVDGGMVFRGARVREKNAFGSGQRVELYYLEHDVVRDYGVGWEDPQLAGYRWDAGVALGRTRAGTTVIERLQYPFLGEAGRRAARQSFERSDLLFDYVAPPLATDQDVIVPVREQSFDMAAVGKLGPPGDVLLVGGGLSFRNRSFPGRVDVLSDRSFQTRTAADSTLVRQVAGQMLTRDDVRAVLLLGQRRIRWIQRRGYDSPRGQQDIRLGGEVSLALSRSLPSMARDNDVGATTTLYAGFQAGPALVVLRGRGDGLRRDAPIGGGTRWEDLYGEAELLAYMRTEWLPTHTFVFRGGGAGGWQTRAPFQLTLGGDDAVRGYDPHRFPGGRRVSLSGEDRLYFHWPFPELFDLGATVFADAGRIWAGDAPFGVNSGWRTAVGAGLRGAFPAGGRTTYRADIAVPVAGSLRNARFTLSVGEVIGLARARLNGQLERSRPQGLTGDIFSFPR